MADFHAMGRAIRCAAAQHGIQIAPAHVVSLGELVGASLLGQPLLILNSARVAYELLDKKGALYSDRPSRPMMKLADIGRGVAASPTCARHTRMRAMLTRTIGTRDAVARFAMTAEAKTHAFVRRLLRGTDPLKTNIEKCVVRWARRSPG